MLRGIPIMLQISASIVLGAATTGAVAWGIASTYSEQFSGAVFTKVNSEPPRVRAICQRQTGGVILQESYIFAFTESRCGLSTSDVSSLSPQQLEALRIDYLTDTAEDVLKFSTMHDLRRSSRAARPSFGSGRVDGEGFQRRRELAVGWPFVAVWCELPETILTPVFVTPRGSLTLSTETRLPYLPIWKGIAINTAIYALAWHTLLFSSRAFVRRRRRRAGRCARCGYDLVGVPRPLCPECGTPCDNPNTNAALNS
jgi:hypothetical protein